MSMLFSTQKLVFKGFIKPFGSMICYLINVPCTSSMQVTSLVRKQIDLWSYRSKWNIPFPVIWWIRTAKSHKIKYFISYTGAAAKLEHRTPHSPSSLPGWHAISLKTVRGKTWRSNALHSGWLWLKKEEEERIKPAPLTADGSAPCSDGSAPCSNVLWQSVTPHFSIPFTCHLVLHSLWDQESSHSRSLCCEISPSSEEKESTVKYVRTANAAFFYVIRW